MYEQESFHLPGEGVRPEVTLLLPEVKAEVMASALACQSRGLAHTFKWLSEILFSLRNVKRDSGFSPPAEDSQDCEVYLMAKSYFDLKEYERCAFFTKDVASPKVQFLHFYSKYLAGEKKTLDNHQSEIATISNPTNLQYLKDLRSDLQKMYDEQEQDGYLSYLYGLVLKKLGLNNEAKEAFQVSIAKEPCLWGAWQELAYFISDRTALLCMRLPEHWMKNFFLAHCYLELLLNDSAMDIYLSLQSNELSEFTYITAQLAIAYYNKRELDQAVELFKELSSRDPYRLDNLDMYSNVLYVKEERVLLAHLAHHSVQIDKYRPETCCIVGNYYSLRSQHAKAVLYFQRALKLNPNYLSAWTLMGHEFMELKNKSAAIQSYRQAIEVNPRDYRAWYGLGQTYEILKMYSYCLYYYKKAQELRPNDSRMLMALGDSYEKLDKLSDALKCYWKAHCLGDIEQTIALFHLARLYDQTDDCDQAAAAYHQYILESEADSLTDDRDQLGRAYRYLANYHVKKGQLEEAYHFAQKCTEFADTREEGKALIKDITSRRGNNQEEKLSTVTPLERGVNDRVLRETNASFASSPEDNARTHDLEPMNLTYTP